MEGSWPSHHHDVNSSSLKGSLQGPKPPVDCCQMDGPGTNLGTGSSTSYRLEGHAGTTPARTFPADGVDKQKSDKKKPYSWTIQEEEEERKEDGKRVRTGGEARKNVQHVIGRAVSRPDRQAESRPDRQSPDPIDDLVSS